MRFKSAYSLLELLIVIAIMAIIAGTLIPLLGMYTPGIRLSGDAKTLMAALRKTQQWSISGEKRFGINFYPEQNQYRLFRRDVDEITQEITITEIETIDLAPNIKIHTIVFDSEIQNDDPRIQFDSFGAPRNTDDQHIQIEISLINSKNAILKIAIRKNTGHISIE